MNAPRLDYDRTTYEDPGIVALYSETPALQPPEQTFLDALRPAIGDMDVLDLGVGTGRSARFFAPPAKSYLGLDYSSTMIERCRQQLPHFDFVLGDASRLDFVADASYDVVLFTYNGIDHLGLAGRQRALSEMRRVLRPRGKMLFSSHNTNFLPEIVERYRFRIGGGVRETLRSMKWSLVFNLHNPTLRFRLPLRVDIVNDGLHDFRTAGVCYIRPDVQITALRELGMDDIQCAENYSTAFIDGGDASVAMLPSPWVYYICRKP
ncbi:MAG: class I SAM-dependent methyltransferase [Alphaproteobacteria bacterium]|nr:class I SAM-dependent methyltransferase [Alphaproteobacteria bacterium]MBV8406093.1 class I SAM-dependent methyltransferase [Alphaproteobacteria bacterium]